MREISYKIENLSCSYRNGKEVLRIKNIAIPDKKLIILLGKSGSGKSTFLEILGLMNNTICRGDVIFYPENGKTEISFVSLWASMNLKEVAKIRNDYFSFIFQNTNLMPNFSAYENALISELIGGASLDHAAKKVTSLLNELGLGEITYARKASEMSGGQKQRIAFIRAIASRFKILFGDEPTGNLDDFNSRELINFLKKYIMNNNKTAIIVSHNVNLSMEFGDIIMVLTKSPDKNGVCELLSDNVFSRSEMADTWMNHNHASYTSSELSSKIQSLLCAV